MKRTRRHLHPLCLYLWAMSMAVARLVTCLLPQHLGSLHLFSSTARRHAGGHREVAKEKA